MSKLFSTLLYTLVVTASICLTASSVYCWQIRITPTDGELTSGEYHTVELLFEGEPDENLNALALSVIHNPDIVDWVHTEGMRYEDDGIPISLITWQCAEFTGDPKYVDIHCQEPVNNPETFFPVAHDETLLTAIWYQAKVSGYYEDIALLGTADNLIASNFITVNNTKWDMNHLHISEDGPGILLSPQAKFISHNDNINTTTKKNTTLSNIPFTISDPQNRKITITAVSSNPSVFPTEMITFGCGNFEGCTVTERSGESDIMTVTPQNGNASGLYFTAKPSPGLTDGISDITLTAASGAIVQTDVIQLRIENAAPDISTFWENINSSFEGEFSFKGEIHDWEGGRISIWCRSSDPSIIPHANIVLTTEGTEGTDYTISDGGVDRSSVLEKIIPENDSIPVTLSITPAEGQTGTVDVTIFADDGTSVSNKTLQAAVGNDGEVIIEDNNEYITPASSGGGGGGGGGGCFIDSI